VIALLPAELPVGERVLRAQSKNARQVEKYNNPTARSRMLRAAASATHEPPIGWEPNFMLESKPPNNVEALETLARRTPTGAVALCAVAVAIVIGIWIAFYLFAFLPRGMVR
jgi:hypothetical protein